MSLAIGARLGPYEIQSAIGAGGMGEVYCARDTRLDRTVAIKVLPEALAADPQFRDRFDWEAKAISQLTHPHICTLYDIGHQDGTSYLVLEFLEGETLAQRLEKGALPLDQALKAAIEIASALDKAHRAGITHRDLKPGNIMLTKAGAKLLDYGLAKGSAPAAAGVGLSMLPTTPANLTAQGAILGTFQYMAPEQLEGKETDARTDIFALGAVLYEMLTGKKAFEGKTHASLIAAILEREPPNISSLQPLTPSGLDRVVRKCLAKDPDARWQNAGDLHDELRWIAEAPGGESTMKGPQMPLWRRLALVGFPALFAGAAIAGGSVWLAMHSSVPPPSADRGIRAELPLGISLGTVESATTRLFALSPDGARLVYVGREANSTSLYLQNLDSGAVTPLPGTTDARSQFFSPDGQWIGFISGPGEPRLKKLRLSGGLPTEIAPVTPQGLAAVWTSSGDIVFSGSAGLLRVSADGGNPVVIAALGPDDGRFDDPRLILGADVLLFSVRSKRAMRSDDESQIATMSLRTGQRRVLVPRGGSPVFVSTGGTRGHLIYGLGNQLLAAPFDLESLNLTASAAPVVTDVQMRANGDAAQFSISETGTIVYLDASQAELLWVNRSGATRRLSTAVRRFAMPRFSPDGHMLAVEIQDTPHQIWLLDIERDVLTPLTRTPRGSHNFAWAPDGRSIIFTLSGESGTRLEWIRTDGSGETKTIFEDKSPWVNAWSRDGRWLAIYQAKPRDRDVELLPLDGGSPPTVRGPVKSVAAVPGVDERADAFSPNGRWLAFLSRQGSTTEVFLQRLADGARFQVSSGGGAEPVWAPTSNELYFRNATHIMVVEVDGTGDAHIGRPSPLFEDEYQGWNPTDFDITPDGKQFVMIRSASATSATHLNLRLSWFEDLKRLVPTK